MNLSEVAAGSTATVVAITSHGTDDPYPAMIQHLGIAIGTVLESEGFDDAQDVYVFRDPTGDVRIGVPLESCEHVLVSVT